MKVALDKLLKTQCKKSTLDELMKTKKLSGIRDYLLKGKWLMEISGILCQLSDVRCKEEELGGWVPGAEFWRWALRGRE